MPGIDPNIALQGRPIEMPDPIAQYGRIMGLKNAMQQQQLHAQQQEIGAIHIQQAKRQQEDQAKGQQAYMQAQGDPMETIRLVRTSGASPEYINTLEKQFDEEITRRITRKKSEVDLHEAVSKNVRGLLMQAKALPPDQLPNYWPTITSELMRNGVPQEAIPQQPDAQFLQTLEFRSNTDASIDAAAKAKQDAEAAARAQAEEDRKAKLFPNQQAKLTAEAKLATDTAAGKAPIQPAQQAMMDAQQKYQQSLLNQGAQRIAQGAQRLSLEGQRVQREASKKDASEQAIEAAAQSLAANDLTRLRDIASLRGDQRLLIFTRAKEINPKLSLGEIDRKIKMEDAFTNGKDGQNLQSFGVFIEHAGAAKDVLDRFKTTDATVLNRSVNWVRSHTSSPQYRDLLAAYEPVKKEFESFLLNNRALYADDRANADKILNEDLPLKDAMAAMSRMMHTAEARYREMNYRYKRTMGHDIQDPFSPEAVSVAKKFGVNLGAAQGGGSGLGAVSTEELFKRLGNGK